MAFDNTLTVIGNVVANPELQFISSGVALATFSIADNQKKANGESEAHYFDCVAWRELGEHLAESFTKGDRVIVHGKLIQNRWQNENGDNRTQVKVVVEDAGPSCRWATTVTTKVEANTQTTQKAEPVPDHEPF